MQTSRKQKVLVFLCVLSVAASPVSVAAIERSGTTAPSKPKTNCQVLDQVSTNLQNQLSARKAKVDSKRTEVSKKVGNTTENRVAELSTKRAEWDSQRQKNFDILRDKANTDAQKEAVEDYITVMMQAIQARRTANDAVLSTYRSEIESFKKIASQSVEANVSTSSAGVSQAIATARAACESGQSIDTVKQNLDAALLVGRMQAKDNRTTTLNSEQLKASKQKRDDALKANIATFNQTTKEARVALKKAFSDE